jgi:hypothetical protein
MRRPWFTAGHLLRLPRPRVALLLAHRSTPPPAGAFLACHGVRARPAPPASASVAAGFPAVPLPRSAWNQAVLVVLILLPRFAYKRMLQALRARTENRRSSIAAAVSSGRRGTPSSVLSLPKSTAPWAPPCLTEPPQPALSLLRPPEVPRRRTSLAAGLALRGQPDSGHSEPPRDHPQVARGPLVLPLSYSLTAGDPYGRIWPDQYLPPPPAMVWIQLLGMLSFQGARC